MEEHVKKQIDLHKKIAKNYEERYGHEYALLFQDYWNETILNAISNKVNSDASVLELGCGTGTFLSELTARFDKVFGVDISIDMLKILNLDSKNLKGALVGDGMRLPFKTGAFDFVVCRGVYHHLPDLHDAFVESNRILKKGGILIFSEPSNDSMIVQMARKKMYKESDKFSEDDIAFHSDELQDEIKNAGFELAKIIRFGFLSYVFAGFPDHFDLLSKIPGNKTITRLFILMDKILTHIPVINRQSLHIIMLARKVA